MRAVVLEEHGNIDSLLVKDIPDPICNQNQVIVKIKACSINHLDIFVRKGMPGHPINLPIIPGGDGAGEVIEIGDNVSEDMLGKKVLIDPNVQLESGRIGIIGEDADGVLCEKIALSPSRLIQLDNSIDLFKAACLPIAYGAAWRMLNTRGKIQPGEQILILGASGGVGNAAIQIAKLNNCFIIAATSSKANESKLYELGADIVINYSDEPDFHKIVRSMIGDGVDIAINFTGGDSWIKTLKCMKPNGRILTCGATAGFNPKTDIRYIWRKELQIIGSNSWTKEDIVSLVSELKKGTINPIIHEIIPFDQISKAHKIIESRNFFGKIVISI